LTIAKGLVERMGGTIGVYSAPYEATTFWFSLPEAVAPTAVSSTPASGGDEIAQVRTLHQVGPATILYVEDTAENLALVRRLLGRFANIRYLEAETAELGIEVARREKPDVILMDMRLPGMSGIEALAVLRADPATQGMTVIGLTGAAMPHEAREIKVAGFDGYITKPFRIATLLEALVQALDRRARKSG
jgi:CheY-like chemotaxis protein